MVKVLVKNWTAIREHLAAELDAEGRRMERAETTEQMWRAQGRAQVLRELLNLPDTLSVLQEGV